MKWLQGGTGGKNKEEKRRWGMGGWKWNEKTKRAEYSFLSVKNRESVRGKWRRKRRGEGVCTQRSAGWICYGVLPVSTCVSRTRESSLTRCKRGYKYWTHTNQAFSLCFLPSLCLPAPPVIHTNQHHPGKKTFSSSACVCVWYVCLFVWLFLRVLLYRRLEGAWELDGWWSKHAQHTNDAKSHMQTAFKHKTHM